MGNPVKEILEKAQDILLEHGRTTDGLFIDEETKEVCAMGAIRLASGWSYERGFYGYDWHRNNAGPEYWEALGALDRQRPSNYYTLPEWNDDPGTTTEDIILGLKKAAAEL